MWGVDDVSRWMESLSLGQYCAAFREATVDGPFLMELREEDLIQVLGVTHKLHVRKIIVSREKLKPLSKQEIIQKEVVEHEVSPIPCPPSLPSSSLSSPLLFVVVTPLSSLLLCCAVLRKRLTREEIKLEFQTLKLCSVKQGMED
jgi:hypothetical protein